MMDVRLRAVLELHRLEIRAVCGARSIPLVHHHGAETDLNPGPLRVMRCSNLAGHKGLHMDAICCWTFRKFADWQVASVEPRSQASCAHCHVAWPCETVALIQAEGKVED